MKDSMKVVFFCAGAVGASVGAWVASKHENTYFLDRDEIADTIERDGIAHYEQGN